MRDFLIYAHNWVTDTNKAKETKKNILNSKNHGQTKPKFTSLTCLENLILSQVKRWNKIVFYSRLVSFMYAWFHIPKAH